MKIDVQLKKHGFDENIDPIISREQEDVRITGHLDMILWNTIHMDINNELFNAFERTFKLCM